MGFKLASTESTHHIPWWLLPNAYILYHTFALVVELSVCLLGLVVAEANYILFFCLSSFSAF